ncbi:hypothetical protein CDD83_9066 [Cordyceps sp. RAO-2017]|nr:hypothetical protein CDD83_9066 [Cordyceps sp. RAO-2017]
MVTRPSAAWELDARGPRIHRFVDSAEEHDRPGAEEPAASGPGGGADPTPPSPSLGEQEALSVFDLYGVARPDGLVPRRKARTAYACHACGESLASRSRCPSCGHDFCVRCVVQINGVRSVHVPERQGKQPSPHGTEASGRSGVDSDVHPSGSVRRHMRSDVGGHVGTPDAASSSENPQRGTTRSGRQMDEGLVGSPPYRRTSPAAPGFGSAVKDNPFFKADRTARALALTPRAEPSGTWATKKAAEASDRVPRRSAGRPSTEFLEQRVIDGGGCDHERCSSICCAARRPLPPRGGDDDDGEDGELQRTIRHLCRRAEDLHACRRDVEDEAGAADLGDCSSASSTGSPSRRAADASHGQEGHSSEQDEVLSAHGQPRPRRLEEDASVSASRPHDLDPDDVFAPDRAADVQSRRLQEHWMTGSGDSSESADSSNPSRPSSGSSAARRRRESWGSGEPRCPPAYVGDGAQHSTAGAAAVTGRHHSPIESAAASDVDVRAAARLPLPSSSAASNTGPDIPSMTGYRQHRRGTTLCLPAVEGGEAKAEAWPRLRRVEAAEQRRSTPEASPWPSRSSRLPFPGDIAAAASADVAEETYTTPSTWRLGLRKTTTKKKKHKAESAAEPTAASQWRQKLVKTTPARAERRTTDRCMFCDPGSGSPGPDCSHAGSAARGHDGRAAGSGGPATPATLRVRQVERSLARTERSEKRAGSSPDGSSLPDGGGDDDACEWRDGRPATTTAHHDRAKTETEDGWGSDSAGRGTRGGDRGLAVSRPGRAEAEDVGLIEGVTVIIHRRHGQDLVIHTDLVGGGRRASRQHHHHSKPNTGATSGRTRLQG